MPQPRNNSSSGRYDTPVATYRLQLHSGFGFDDVRRLLPYFKRLGISHLYFSPIFAAAPGSTHGYDVVDHNQVNPELGGITALYELGSEMLAHNLGLILDIVPNHVGIAGGRNPWWRDVLRYGRDSQYAQYFDIDWEAQPHMSSGVVNYPILGQPFGAALESGEIRIKLIEHDLAICYYDFALPVAPQTYVSIVSLPPLELRSELGDPASLSGLLEALEAMRTIDSATAPLYLSRFRDIVASEPAISGYIERELDRLNGVPGDPQSFDRLDSILSAQHYRLAYWRISGEEINYRRFFDTNDLAAIRVEREDVFEDTHQLVLDLVAKGIVTGVRIDHVDGLYDPEGYLVRLRSRLRDASADFTDKPVPIYVEKILEEDEKLPSTWPVQGTTGYDFAAHVDGMLVDRSNALVTNETYEEFVGQRVHFQQIELAAKRQIVDSSFTGEITVLAAQLYRIAQRHRRHRDNTLRGLRRTIGAVLASFPVYRTYLSDELDGPQSNEVIERAISEAQRHYPELPDDALQFLQEVLLLNSEAQQPDEISQWMHFRCKFQQLSGPVMAKGFEDTALYRYNRLISLNEVGNNPVTFGKPPQEVHRWFQERAAKWPRAMSASSTHDTKRSEDVRYRLHALSEVPQLWRREVHSWARLNGRHRETLYGEPVPDPNTEYLIYQTLVGSYPETGRINKAYQERIHEYLTKAMREAKDQTSWIAPDERFEAGVHAFVDAILDRGRSPAFLRRLRSFVNKIQPVGYLNGLSALALKCLAPGFPDFYQGMELCGFFLTDPDNRRPVDYAVREKMIWTLGDLPPRNLTEPETKLWLTQRLIGIRRQVGRLVVDGDYVPLRARGEYADRVFAFERRFRSARLLVVVPRLTLGIEQGRAFPLLAERWRDTQVVLPEGQTRWRDLLAGNDLFTEDTMDCAVLFRELPFAVLLAR